MTRLRTYLSLPFILLLSACTLLDAPSPTPTATVVPPTATPSLIPTPTLTPTATPLGCLTQPGRVASGELDNVNPPQLFLVYTPPCYDQKTDERYPVLYLLHGQTYIDDEWVRLGAPAAADTLIHNGTAIPFMMVFPDDRYWNLPPGAGFGKRLINDLIPYIDSHFRTLTDRQYRALGGLSRGGGWTVELGLQHYDMFGALGMNSPAIFVEDSAYVKKWVASVPADAWPRLWIDAGDRDRELSSIKQFENLLSSYNVPHEWRNYTGDHSEDYWRLHVAEYLQWYADGWIPVATGTGTATATVTVTPGP